jgi:hypothetical protein
MKKIFVMASMVCFMWWSNANALLTESISVDDLLLEGNPADAVSSIYENSNHDQTGGTLNDLGGLWGGDEFSLILETGSSFAGTYSNVFFQLWYDEDTYIG